MTKRGRSAVVRIFAVITGVATAAFFMPGTANAFGLFTPFGGRVLEEVPCTCSAGAMITVGLPRPGVFIITPASKIYRNYMPLPGHWVLGIAVGETACMVTVPIPIPPFVTCTPAGFGGAIFRMGTS